MFLLQWLVLFLVGFHSHAVDSSSGLAALCSQVKGCSTPYKDLISQVQSTCEIENKALNCEELARKNPEMTPLLRRCDIKTRCRQEEEFQKQKELACLRGYKNALVDTGIALKDMAVSLGEYVENSWDNFKSNIKRRNEFLRQCNTSLSCKKDLVKEDHRYNQLSDEALNKYSATFLYVQAENMKAYKSSMDRAPVSWMSRKASKEEGNLTPSQNDKLKDLMAMAEAKLKEEYNKFSCYNALAKTEMACYAIGNVVDPTMLAGAVFKGARLAGAAGKLLKTEEGVRAVDVAGTAVAKRGWALGRSALVREYLHYSPTTVAQNERWIALAEKGVSSELRYLDVENSQLKKLNDVLKDKNLVTSLTNFHKKLLFDRIEKLKKEFPDLKIEEYSDFKSSRFAFGGKVPKDLEQRLQKIFTDANNEFEDYLKSEKIVRAEDPAQDWFRAGLGQSAEQANVAARYSRQEATNVVQSYSQAKLTTNLTAKLTDIERTRQILRHDLGGTSMLEGKTLHEDVFDIVRKNMGDSAKTAAALSQRFGLKSISGKTVEKLQTYVKGSDEFSPGIFVPKREVAHLNDADLGGLSADVIGLGASNMKGTSEALARSPNLDQVLVETRKAEKAVTAQFQAQKKYFEDVVKRSVDPGKLKTVCSGDDCVAIAVKPLNESDKKKILAGLADSKYSGKFRLAFIPEGIKDIPARNALSTHGESVEKLLRSSLGSVMEPRKLQGLTFGLDMKTQSLNAGGIKLLIGEAPGVHLSAQERKLIQKKFEESVRELNEGFQSKGVKSSYHPE